ncbi:MAG: hypothetical protein ACOY5B_07650 [Spirochaetota bacterium]
MNYPIKVKKAFNRVRYQVHDAWQNLRLLKRNISCLVRSIDDVGNRVNRSRQLLQGIALREGCASHVEAETGVHGGGYP